MQRGVEGPTTVLAGSIRHRAARLRSALRKQAGPPTHPDLRAYLGAPLPVLGVSARGLEQVARSFLRTDGELTDREFRSVLKALWAGKAYEERALAIVILGRARQRLNDAVWTLMDRWVDSATGWALSDALAGGPVAEVVARDRHRWQETLRWTRSANRWRRRAALYAQNRLIRRGELDRPFRVIDALRADPEFWVRRAVGTWLRECWKQDEARTRRYLWRHARSMAPVVITVATERAPPTFRRSLRERARAR